MVALELAWTDPGGLRWRHEPRLVCADSVLLSATSLQVLVLEVRWRHHAGPDSSNACRLAQRIEVIREPAFVRARGRVLCWPGQ